MRGSQVTNLLIVHCMCLSGMGGAFTGGGTLGLEPGSGPCVGVCYYVKKRGLTVGKRIMEKLKKRKPCIGLCFLKKKKGKKAAEKND